MFFKVSDFVRIFKYDTKIVQETMEKPRFFTDFRGLEGIKIDENLKKIEFGAPWNVTNVSGARRIRQIGCATGHFEPHMGPVGAPMARPVVSGGGRRRLIQKILSEPDPPTRVSYYIFN